MRNRSKSCFVPHGEVQKLYEEEEYYEVEENEKKISPKIFDEVITKILQQIPPNDEISFEERLKQVKWKKIQCGQHSYKQIKKLILSLIEKARKHRILKEILGDITYIFNNEDANIKSVLNKYNLDRPQKKEVPDKTPFLDYFDHLKLKDNGVKYFEARKMYKEMDDSEKIMWLLKFLNVSKGEKLNLSQYTTAKKVMTIAEMKLIDQYEKKPKYNQSAYNMFVRDYIKNAKENAPAEMNHIVTFKKATEAWKELPEHEKQKLKNHAKELKAEYEEKMKNFEESLPEDRKGDTVKKSKRKNEEVSKDTRVKQPKITQYGLKLKIQKNNVNEKNKKKKNSTYTEVQNSSVEEHNIEDHIINPDYSKKHLLQNGSSKNINTSSQNIGTSHKKLKKSKKNNEGNEVLSNQEVTENPSNFSLKKPPVSLYKFYVLNVHKGPKKFVKSSFKQLSKEDKAKLSVKHQKAQKKFLRKFTEYLNTLSVEQIQQIRSQNDSEEENLSDITESSYQSDY